MATTRKPSASATPPRRPSPRGLSEGPSVPSSPPSPIEDTAAYAIGYQAGLVEGQRIGAERERAVLATDESIDERITRHLKREMYPRRERAIDLATSWIAYTIGATTVIGYGVLIWRLLQRI